MQRRYPAPAIKCPSRATKVTFDPAPPAQWPTIAGTDASVRIGRSPVLFTAVYSIYAAGSEAWGTARPAPTRARVSFWLNPGCGGLAPGDAEAIALHGQRSCCLDGTGAKQHEGAVDSRQFASLNAGHGHGARNTSNVAKPHLNGSAGSLLNRPKPPACPSATALSPLYCHSRLAGYGNKWPPQ
jgi:hypothetical protein